VSDVVTTLYDPVAELVRLRAQREAVLELHQRSTYPATHGRYKGRRYCLYCTLDAYTSYVDWPCPTAQALGVIE
jgi:hypothetical protein